MTRRLRQRRHRRRRRRGRAPGGSGTDVAYYGDRTTRVNVTVGAGNDNDGNELDQTGNSLDTVHGDIETVLGGSGPDVLVGDGSDETLFGGDGDDAIFGEPRQGHACSASTAATSSRAMTATTL